jgi:death-on-curing family protein
MKKNSNDVEKGEIVIYKAKDNTIRLDVRLEKETVWLSQFQMAKLFNKTSPTINEHLKNIYHEGELERNSTIRKFRIVQIEGKRRIERNIDFYNLDVIISVGYRVKSMRGTQFRIWATTVLRNYLVKGYALNQKRLHEHERALKELRETIAFITSKASHPQLNNKAEDLLKLLNEYSSALTILYEYDNKSLSLASKTKPYFVLGYDLAIEIISNIKAKLIERNEASNLFGHETGNKFKSIIGALYQTFDKKDLYLSVEEKASHLLYLIIKDHPFSDGNKRIASLMFVYFLEKNGYLYKANGECKVTNNTVVAISLLIAASDPREKDMMIKIVTNLIV